MRETTNNASGFSLLELMIAMTVTITIATIASSLVAQSLHMRSREDARSDAIADAQRALNIVSREIANSGFGLIDNGLVPGDTGPGSIRFRSNLNAYTRDASGNPVAGSNEVIDRDEDIKYSMYDDDVANRHYLVRYDVTLGGREGTTVLANRLDSFQLQYFNSTGTELDVVADPEASRTAWKVRITVGVVLPAQGVPGSPGHQPESTINLVSEVVLRNSSQITF
ncbi:MAG TPA: prepilin-type N-terminal cleavage/methylation domain-containing protein [Pyrinomonadaceae bacterium]|nr:prepilin-type N-terminal cleavage/methylation domain-containing protein [Pyrinomonadaceae bacterium]